MAFSQAVFPTAVDEAIVTPSAPLNAIVFSSTALSVAPLPMCTPDPVLPSAATPSRAVPIELPRIRVSVAAERLTPCEPLPETMLRLTSFATALEMYTPAPSLPRSTVPLASAPITLSVTSVPSAALPETLTPCEPLPEITLFLICTRATPTIETPTPPLPWSVAPLGFVPIRLCSITCAPAVWTTIPASPNRLIASPRIQLSAAATVRPFVVVPALVPSSSIRSELTLAPGWLSPSSHTGLEIVGSAEAGWIVCGPAPAIPNSMMPPRPALVCWIAARSVQAPFPSSQIPSVVSLSAPSPVESTVNVAAES